MGRPKDKNSENFFTRSIWMQSRQSRLPSGHESWLRGAPYPAMPEPEDVSSLKARVRSAFSLVELQTKETRGKCDEREIPMLCRTLGLNPTQDQLLSIVEELRDVGGGAGDETQSSTHKTGYVAYKRFEDVMLDLFTTRKVEFTRDNEQTIIRAFKTFDPNGDGFIDAEHLRNLLSTQGDLFDETEVSAFLDAAGEKTGGGGDTAGGGRVYYEDFAAILANDGRRR